MVYYVWMRDKKAKILTTLHIVCNMPGFAYIVIPIDGSKFIISIEWAKRREQERTGYIWNERDGNRNHNPFTRKLLTIFYDCALTHTTYHTNTVWKCVSEYFFFSWTRLPPCNWVVKQKSMTSVQPLKPLKWCLTGKCSFYIQCAISVRHLEWDFTTSITSLLWFHSGSAKNSPISIIRNEHVRNSGIERASSCRNTSTYSPFECASVYRTHSNTIKTA